MADNTAVVPEVDEDEFTCNSRLVIQNIEYLGSRALDGVIELHLNEEDLEALTRMQDELLAWVLRQSGNDDEMIELPNP